MTGSDDEGVDAVVLDFLPTGRRAEGRPQHTQNPVAYALGEEDFRLYELTLKEGASPTVGDHLSVDPRGESITAVREVEYEDLPGAAQSELEYAVSEIIEENERRFVDFYNEAQPITLRLHQLNLLPGIGKKLRNTILDERKRQPFESFEDLEDRVSGLHRPKELLADRILEELREEDLKYRNFARRESQTES